MDGSAVAARSVAGSASASMGACAVSARSAAGAACVSMVDHATSARSVAAAPSASIIACAVTARSVAGGGVVGMGGGGVGGRGGGGGGRCTCLSTVVDTSLLSAALPLFSLLALRALAASPCLSLSLSLSHSPSPSPLSLHLPGSHHPLLSPFTCPPSLLLYSSLLSLTRRVLTSQIVCQINTGRAPIRPGHQRGPHPPRNSRATIAGNH